MHFLSLVSHSLPSRFPLSFYFAAVTGIMAPSLLTLTLLHLLICNQGVSHLHVVLVCVHVLYMYMVGS